MRRRNEGNAPGYGKCSDVGSYVVREGRNAGTHVGFPVPPPHAIVHAFPGFSLVRAYAAAQGIPTKRKGLAV
jgi:hypothetical protein